ncbi:MAG: glycosyltransferase family 4 protein [Acidobacteriota bacterium]
MKILLIHNRYQQKGGEDSVFEIEGRLLEQNGNEVERLIFDNKNISTFFNKIKAAVFLFYNPQSSGILKEKLRTFRPDIIHVHNFFPLASPSIFFRSNRENIPVVLTLHNYRLVCANATLHKDNKICEKCMGRLLPLSGLMKKCYRDSVLQTALVTLFSSFHKIAGTWKKRIDQYIVLTEFQKKIILRSSLKIKEKKLTVKPNFVDDPGEGQEEREDYFLFIGRLSEQKGISTLLDSLNFYNFSLKVVGDGPLKDLVMEKAEIKNNLEYIGFMDRKLIFEYLKKARALIFPSTWYEGFPVVIAEALATGTPVITSNIGSQAEIIIDGYNGIHFNVSDPADLAAKVKYFSGLKNNSMYQNARKEFLEKYSSEKNYRSLIKIYSDAINEKK